MSSLILGIALILLSIPMFVKGIVVMGVCDLILGLWRIWDWSKGR